MKPLPIDEKYLLVCQISIFLINNKSKILFYHIIISVWIRCSFRRKQTNHDQSRRRIQEIHWKYRTELSKKYGVHCPESSCKLTCWFDGYFYLCFIMSGRENIMLKHLTTSFNTTLIKETNYLQKKSTSSIQELSCISTTTSTLSTTSQSHCDTQKHTLNIIQRQIEQFYNGLREEVSRLEELEARCLNQEYAVYCPSGMYFYFIYKIYKIINKL